MATVHTMTNNAKKLVERFRIGSVTEAAIGTEFDWIDGGNAIKLWTLDKAVINDYNLAGTSARFGTMHEVGDEVQTFTLYGNKSFDESFDNQNIKESGFLRKSSAFLRNVNDEQIIPMLDMDRLEKWSEGAGLTKLNSTALSDSTVLRAILEAHRDMNNALVPRTNRITFVSETVAVETALAAQLKDYDAHTKSAIINGQLGQISGSPIVSVPDSYLPTGCEFIIKWKNASVDALTIKTLRAITDSEELDGVRMQGRWRYGSFVLAQKRNGIFYYGSSNMCDNCTYSIASNEVTISCATSGATIKYTTDGTDPKSSSTAATYSSSVTITADTPFRAYASKTGLVSSGVTEYAAVYTA